MKLFNPYLEEFSKINGEDLPEDSKIFHKRNELTAKYSWAVPNTEVIQEIQEFSDNKIVEIGAGTGYWSMLLDQAGADVVAYDDYSWSGEYRKGSFPMEIGKYYPVLKGDEKSVEKHVDRTLLLCWPPTHNEMSSQTVRNFMREGGTKLVYVGEPRDGCTGSYLFHKILYRRWEIKKCVSIPKWFSVHDYAAFMEFNR
jgi:hypothetical protein